MQNKIAYFGHENKDSTFVFEQDESEQLKVAREERGFGLMRGNWNTACCVYKMDIYAFSEKNWKELHRLSMESGKWTLFNKYL